MKNMGKKNEEIRGEKNEKIWGEKKTNAKKCN